MDYGFKCLHYSVSERAEVVVVTVVRKNPAAPEEVGVRTVDDTAKAPDHYTRTARVLRFRGPETTQTFAVPIVNDEEWNPDMDFLIELYDPRLIDADDAKSRLPGSDTRCKVTILDEDKPGRIGFGETDLRVSQYADELVL